MRVPVRHAASAVLAGSAVVASAAVDGGYFPTAWGWLGLGFLAAGAATVLVVDRVDVGPLDAAFACGLAAVVAWAALSALWSESVPRSVIEVERGLVYVAGVSTLLLLARRGSAPWIAAGLLTALVSVATYALATRLFPDRFGYDVEFGRQLARPVGYWNALGVLAALGILLALGFAAGARQRAAIALAAAPLPVLATTLYFTFSRGSLVALAGGVAAMFAVGRDRLRLAAFAVALTATAGCGIALASRLDGLQRDVAPLEAATRDGHRFAGAVLALAAVSALAALLVERLLRAVAVPQQVRRGLGLALAGSAGVVVVAAVFAAGGPSAVVSRAYDAFRAPLPASGGQLEGRLFSVSGNGRSDYWRVAVDAYQRHPFLGTGAGTYELQWMRERPTAFEARDAHNLYLETLAELGPVGLLLLLAALAVPLAAVPAARAHAVGPACCGAYVAFLVHAALDWDWELPVVTLAALSCGVALLVALRRAGSALELTGARRGVALAALSVPALFVFVTYVGNSALARSDDAAAGGRYEAAEGQAKRATRWLPWSSDAHEALAEARLARGDQVGARAAFRDATAKDPRDWRAWYGLARASEGPERRAALVRARLLNPRSAELDAAQG